MSAGAHQSHGFEGRLLRARVWREDDRVARLDPVDRVAGGGEVGVGRRDDAGDDSRRLAVLDDAFFGQLLDDADTLLAQRVAQDAANFHSLAHATHRVAQAALGDAHGYQPRKRLLVCNRPGDCLAKTVDAGLIVGPDDRERLAGPLEDRVQLLLLLLSDAFFRLGSGHRWCSSWCLAVNCSAGGRCASDATTIGLPRRGSKGV
jgi:hypothetical protein